MRISFDPGLHNWGHRRVLYFFRNLRGYLINFQGRFFAVLPTAKTTTRRRSFVNCTAKRQMWRTRAFRRKTLFNVSVCGGRAFVSKCYVDYFLSYSIRTRKLTWTNVKSVNLFCRFIVSMYSMVDCVHTRIRIYCRYPYFSFIPTYKIFENQSSVSTQQIPPFSTYSHTR